MSGICRLKPEKRINTARRKSLQPLSTRTCVRRSVMHWSSRPIDGPSSAVMQAHRSRQYTQSTRSNTNRCVECLLRHFCSESESLQAQLRRVMVSAFRRTPLLQQRRKACSALHRCWHSDSSGPTGSPKIRTRPPDDSDFGSQVDVG
jgi:hypothetical protein